MSSRSLHIGLSLAPTWLSGNGWRRADSQVESIYSVEFYTALAKRAEAAKLDFLFRPDALFLKPEMVGDSPGFSGLDPLVLLSALAHETSHIGLVTTASTTFAPAYLVARQLQSLNWISRGRAGWNIVTSLDGHANFGDAPMPSSETRYQRAREFTEVVRKLWDSYPHDALRIDREAGCYADASQVAPINHHGAHLNVTGPLNIPQHASGDIPLFQAGASEWGRDFAAHTADAIFAATPDLEAGIELRTDIRRRAASNGRSADAIRVLPGLSLFLSRTTAEAHALYRDTHAHPARLPRLQATINDLLGLDVTSLSPNTRVTTELLPDSPTATRSRTHTDLLRRLIARDRPTVSELLARPEVAGSAHWIVVGTPDDAVREIKERFEAGAADGFIALPGGSPQSLDLFFDEVMPRLVEQNLFRRDYTGSTLRNHLGL